MQEALAKPSGPYEDNGYVSAGGGVMQRVRRECRMLHVHHEGSWSHFLQCRFRSLTSSRKYRSSAGHLDPRPKERAEERLIGQYHHLGFVLHGRFSAREMRTLAYAGK